MDVTLLVSVYSDKACKQQVSSFMPSTSEYQTFKDLYLLLALFKVQLFARLSPSIHCGPARDNTALS